MMRISFGSLRTRLILIVLLAVIPAFGLSLYSGLEQRHDALSRAQENALRMAENASDVQERLIENTRQIFFALSQLPEIQNLNPAACSKILKDLQSQSKSYTMFFAVRPNGDLFASALPVSGRMTFADRAWYQQVLKTREFVISEYVIGRISGKAAVTLLYPVFDRKGEMKAILGTGLDLGWLNQFIAESEPPAGTTLTVIDRKGTILLRYPEPEKITGKTMPEGSILKAILAKEEGVLEAIDLDGIPRLYGFTSLDRFARSVYVSVGIPKKIAFAEATRDMRRNLIWLGIVGALAIMAAWFGSSLFIMRPVGRLLGATKRLAEGDLTVRTGPRYDRGEIGQLAFGFDRMADALAEKEAKILEYTQQLEQRVQERTEALRESEERFRIAAQSASDLIWEWDTVKGDLAWFGKIDEMLGYEPGEFPRTIEAWEKIIHPDDHERVMTTLDQHLQTRKPYSEEYRVFRKDGSVLYWVDGGIGLWDEKGKAYKMIGAVSDITDRKKAEDRIRKLNHVYAMLSDINQAIVRIREPQALFKEACRVAVEKGDFPLAWIGLVDDSTKQFRVVASAGKSGGYLEKINISLEGAPLGYCPIDSALREGEQVICNVIGQNEDLAPCQKIAIGLGFRSSASFPLRVSGRILGTFNFYAREADFFDEEERKLLDELAIDISFATEFAEKEAERKRGEEALGESEEKYRNLFQNAQVGMFRSRLDGSGYEAVNDKFAEIHGYSKEELLARASVLSWEDPSARDIAVTALREKGVVTDLEVNIKRKNGEIRTVLSSFQLLAKEGFIEGSVADITERKRAEKALNASEIRYRRLFESSKDGILILDAETGIIVDVNPFSIELLDPLQEGIRGKDLWELGFFRDIVKNRANFLELKQKEYIRYEDLPLKTADGRQINVEFISNVYEVDHQKVIQCNIRDITDRKRAEDEIRRLNESLEKRVQERTAELEAANKEMEAFSYSVSHDLRAPLRAVDGYTRILLEDHVVHLNEDAQKICGSICEGAQRMGKLIDDLLGFSRLSRAEMRSSSVDMHRLANSVFFELTTPESRESVDFRLQPVPRAEGDPTMVRQIWMNLLSNALKFSSKRKRSVIEVGCHEETEETIYYIRDNGAGFDKQYAHKLFGVFQRLHSTREFEGTGVGLAIVRRIVHRHGGRTWAEGETDKGATFYFTLPKKNEG